MWECPFNEINGWLVLFSVLSNKTKQAIQLGYANRIIYSNILLFHLKKRKKSSWETEQNLSVHKHTRKTISENYNTENLLFCRCLAGLLHGVQISSWWNRSGYNRNGRVSETGQENMNISSNLKYLNWKLAYYIIKLIIHCIECLQRHLLYLL